MGAPCLERSRLRTDYDHDRSTYPPTHPNYHPTSHPSTTNQPICPPALSLTFHPPIDPHHRPSTPYHHPPTNQPNAHTARTMLRNPMFRVSKVKCNFTIAQFILNRVFETRNPMLKVPKLNTSFHECPTHSQSSFRGRGIRFLRVPRPQNI